MNGTGKHTCTCKELASDTGKACHDKIIKHKKQIINNQNSFLNSKIDSLKISNFSQKFLF